MTGKRVLLVFGLCACALMGWAQETKKVYRPDFPGSFSVDLGLNQVQSAPSVFKKGLWGSRTLNLYYQYPMRIKNSHFTFVPSAGFAFERFKLVNGYTLNPVDSAGAYNFISGLSIHNGLKKSMIVMDYFDIPLEIKYYARPNNPNHSFWIAAGVRAGVLFHSKTKLRYSENGSTKTDKDIQRHGINPFRYGVSLRMGVGGFNWWAQYNLSPYFKSGEGPRNVTMTTWTVGISINSF